jgi:hypothetical protein
LKNRHFFRCRAATASSSGKHLLVLVSNIGHIRVTMGALERMNLSLKILSGRHAPAPSEIEGLKSSLRVDASQMSTEEIASEVIHRELSQFRAPSRDDAYGRR